MADAFTIQIRGLEKLIKAFKSNVPTLSIGVLGNNSRKQKGGKPITNATLGAIHEFGCPSRNIPQRSFLRIPLTDHLNKELEKSGALDPEVLTQVINSANLRPWMERVAVVAEGIVDDAFESSGDGKWPHWKNPDYTNEGGMLLVDTGGLRESITSKVR